MKIVTLTLNPAFDVHCKSNKLELYHENIAEITSVEAGGKGVNISRALRENGVDSLAVIIIGSENGNEFLSALERDKIVFSAITVPGRIRENITLHEELKPETRISFNGAFCGGDVLSRVKECAGECDENTVLTFTGSAPSGISAPQLKAMLCQMKNKGARLVIDSRAFTLNDITDLKPWLIKPNKDEAQSYTGVRISNPLEGAELARALYEKGVENVLISLGKDGAVLACREGVFHAAGPDIKALSTIGAGDSSIAGFISAAAEGKDAIGCLKTAVAFGTAACLREGSRPPKKADIDKISSEIAVKQLFMNL